MTYSTIEVQTLEGVGVITLDRPDALNALSAALMHDAVDALTQFEKDDAIKVIVLTGSAKAFAAGADIKEMVDQVYPDVYTERMLGDWDRFARCRKPVIAAVAGYALGGGCELAMMCDVIYAADTAQFGQPEIKLGVIPGLGGTQRLTRVVGKAKAMDMCLTGRMMKADEAERSGLVSRIFPADQLVDETLKLASQMAQMSTPVLQMVKDCVNTALETPLEQGIAFERRQFYSLFGTPDQKEGMTAFINKEKPKFQS
ncbi:MAG: enoyl-CoA hydratase [Gammaproteobacteria bacterium]|nr:enoyl-CoA hydratase [Gammaproteobacteria bacterium]